MLIDVMERNAPKQRTSTYPAMRGGCFCSAKARSAETARFGYEALRFHNSSGPLLFGRCVCHG